MFTIAESLILLGTDDEKGTSVSSASLGYGLAGSILAELAMMERLSLEDDKVIIIDDTLTEVSYFNSVIEEIKADHKARTVEYWVNHFANNTKAVHDPVYLSLVDKGILKEEDKTYFSFSIQMSILRWMTVRSRQSERMSKILYLTVKRLILKLHSY